MRNTALAELYDYLDLDLADSLADDVKAGYLTENSGRDGADYFYYFDGAQTAAVNIETAEVVTDEERLDRLFG